MRGKSWFFWLIGALIISLPLVLSSDTYAESGCHRAGGSTGGSSNTGLGG
jgi:hypothetical protein